MLKDAHYWQRSNFRESMHADTVQLQEMLNRDISVCTADVRDMNRTNNIRKAMPANKALDKNNPAATLSEWETPERDGYLRAEHYPYHDFETCMIAKGWERTEDVPKPVVKKSKENYWKTLGVDTKPNPVERNTPQGESYFNL
jgi:hypothetical protein